MTKFSAPAGTVLLSFLFLATTLPAQNEDAAPQAAGTSKVRIVRLSEVKGDVLLDRHNGRGFEHAMANLPIVEQSRLQTGTGAAEVEFEDNSTLRLAPDSLVEFPRLERMASGATASTVHLVKGMAYVSLVKTAGNQFELLFGQRSLPLPPASHVRLQLEGTEAKLAVLDGALKIDSPSGTMDVPKKKTVTFPLENEAQPTVSREIASEAFDSWDQTSTGYHARTASLMSSNNSPYAYGVNDMAYYGTFMDAGGCGSMWRPYFASAGWNPYSNGAYAWYQGAGYSWVSPYPWGWTPYHYGSWSYCDGTGWGWQPGGTWNGLNNTLSMMSRLGSGMPLVPVHPPKAGEPALTPVNLKPLVKSEMTSAESFEFRKDSAGLGIPRDGMGKLEKLSRQSLEHGTARTPIFMSAPASANYNGRVNGATLAATSIHRGYAPQRDESNSFSQGNTIGRSGGSSNASVSASNAHQSAPSSGGGAHH